MWCAGSPSHTLTDWSTDSAQIRVFIQMARIFLLTSHWPQQRVSLFRRPQNRVTDDSRASGGGEEPSDFSISETFEILQKEPLIGLSTYKQQSHENTVCVFVSVNWFSLSWREPKSEIYSTRGDHNPGPHEGWRLFHNEM